MASVIERKGYSVDDDGFIHYDDSPATYEAAEKIYGRRLDRRKSYAIIQGEVCDVASWTQQCSNCEGGGCRECGYSGKVRRVMWTPMRE